MGSDNGEMGSGRASAGEGPGTGNIHGAVPGGGGTKENTKKMEENDHSPRGW